MQLCKNPNCETHLDTSFKEEAVWLILFQIFFKGFTSRPIQVKTVIAVAVYQVLVLASTRLFPLGPFPTFLPPKFSENIRQDRQSNTFIALFQQCGDSGILLFQCFTEDIVKQIKENYFGIREMLFLGIDLFFASPQCHFYCTALGYLAIFMVHITYIPVFFSQRE